jgi:hypothetical protein
VEGAEGEVEGLVEAESAAEVLGEEGVVGLDEGDQFVQLLGLELLRQQLLVKKDEQRLGSLLLKPFFEGGFGLGKGRVAVPLVDLEELTL